MKSLPAPSYLTNFTSTSDSGYIIGKNNKTSKSFTTFVENMRIRRYRQAPVLFLQKTYKYNSLKSVLFKLRFDT